MTSGRVSSVAFVDVECTGLSHPQPPTRITELAVVAVDADELGHTKRNADDDAFRVVNRLTLCFRPRATVSLAATQLSGLDNFSLESQAVFDEDAVRLWCSFLARLRKPVLLVAHNGNALDFPLIKAELLKASQNCAFQSNSGADLSDLFVVDSLELMRAIYDEPKGDVQGAPITPPPSSVKTMPGDECRDGNVRKKRRRLLPDDSYDEKIGENDNEEELANPLPASPPLASDDQNEVVTDNGDGNEVERDQFVTPEKTIATTSLLPPRIPRKQRVPVLANGRLKVRKRLDFSRPSSFQLAHLHQHFCGGQLPSRVHRAEADCETLLKVFSAEWTRLEPRLWDFARPWGDVSPLWTQKQNGSLQTVGSTKLSSSESVQKT